jgi:hypothetical protein
MEERPSVFVVDDDLRAHEPKRIQTRREYLQLLETAR